ncbi:MAG: DUF721 domain-containing protein [Treponema sp.]|nr:DUF721 domain-containing protein [Treponema sp.]MBR4629798.1 DUF721 domain-containing protein [Treponema sp.]
MNYSQSLSNQLNQFNQFNQFDDNVHSTDSAAVRDMNSGMVDAMQLVSCVIDGIDQKTIVAGDKILRSWRAIIESIRPNSRTTKNAENYGKNLASHSKIVDFRNGILLVEADHSSWLQMLQLHKKYILGCIQRRFPDLAVSTLAFRLRGSNVGLSVTYEESLRIEREKLSEKYEREEKMLDEMGFGAKVDAEKVPELPPELKVMFDRMKASILTKEKNV